MPVSIRKDPLLSLGKKTYRVDSLGLVTHFCLYLKRSVIGCNARRGVKRYDCQTDEADEDLLDRSQHVQDTEVKE